MKYNMHTTIQSQKKYLLCFMLIIIFISCENSSNIIIIKPKPFLNGSWRWVHFISYFSTESIELVLTQNNDSISGTAKFTTASLMSYHEEIFGLNGTYKFPNIELNIGVSYHAKGTVNDSSGISLILTNINTNEDISTYFDKQ
ncbi:MAG: hypothetical protein NT007_10740 [Candidatus Kapabacteria bacterium]|nr:hypothetical protein [Candidatus Kapabacteria bacterium]